MSIQIKRGLEVNRNSFTPLVGEFVWTTDDKKLYIGDGTTVGGILLDTSESVSETITSISLSTNILTYTDENGTDTNLDLSLYLDDTNLAYIQSGVLNGATGIATFTRSDASTFTVDLSDLLDDTSVTVNNTLTSDSTTEALSAAQGKALKTLIDASTGTVYTESITAPTSPSLGDEWFHRDSGILYKRVSDGVDAVWLDISGTGMSSGGSSGSGDMLASTYDTGGNGVVDNAELVNGLTVETAVPAGAVFTDTIYDETDVVKAPLGVLPSLDGSNLTNLPSTAIARHIGIIVVAKATAIVTGNDIIGAIEIPFDATVTEVRAKTASGTATVVFKNEGSIIGNVNATTSGVSNTTLSNTVIGVWDDLTIDVSAASGSGLAITIILQET